MAFIHLPQRWNRQPQGAVGVDWSNPLSAGVEFLLTPCGNALFDCVRNKVWNSTNNSTTYISTVYGIKSATFTPTGYFTATGYAALPTTIGTCFAFIPFVGVSSVNGHIYLGSGGSNCYLQLLPTTPNWFNTQNRTLVLSRSTQKAFLSGKDESSSFAYGSATWASGAKTLVVGGANWAGTSWDLKGSIAFIGYSNIAWSIENAQEFTKNPWQIFKPLNRVIYFPVSSSGLTSVQQDSFVRWNIIQAIHNDAQLKWDVRIAVENDTLIKWNVLTGVLADTELSWNTLTSAQNALELKWHLLERITADVSIYWNLLTSAQKDAVTAWNTLSAIHTDCAVRWDNLTAAQQSVLLEWNLATAAQNDIRIQWNALTSAQRDALLQWNILSEVFSASNDAVLRWDSLATAQQSALMRWNLLSAAEKALATRWDILKAIDVSIATRWDIANAIATELTARWDIATAAFADTTLTWDMLAISENAIELRWDIGDSSVTPPIRIFLVRGENRVFTVAGSNRSF